MITRIMSNYPLITLFTENKHLKTNTLSITLCQKFDYLQSSTKEGERDG